MRSSSARPSSVSFSRALCPSASWSVLAPVLWLLPACGSLAEGRALERTAAFTAVPSGSSGPAQRRHAERRAERTSQLFGLARDVGAMPSERVPSGLSAVPPELAEPPAASGGDAGVLPDVVVPLDAGLDATPDAGAAPSAPAPLPEPDVGLPHDIVERSALPIYGLEAGVVLTEAALWDRLATSPAICFGEYHDEPAHHHAEVRAISELEARARAAGHPFAVGFEMIQRPFQGSLSAFAAGEIGEAEFIARSEYAQRWGFDLALYRPLFERARDLHLPALALNMRAEITRKIARTGLASLDARELAEVPELVLDDEEHRAFIFGLFGVLPGHGEESGLEGIYTAQTVWDETMADTSARWLRETGPNARLLDFAGGVHCHRSAIPRRITRRTPEQPALGVHAVFESELADGSFTPEGYDLLVVLDD